MVLVTHDAAAVERMCSRALFLERGRPVAIGPAHDVVTMYHDHLAAEDTSASAGSAPATPNGALELDIAIVDPTGTQRHRFTEGEEFTVRLVLSAPRALASTRTSITVRDELSREIGTQFIDGVAFEAAIPRTLSLNLAASPLRNGHFQIDVAVTDLETRAVHLEARAAESITVLGQLARSDGPVQLNGTWDTA
jgi:hypothetical protein